MSASTLPSEPTGADASSKKPKNVVWFSDGNLVIQVKGPNKTHLHRVHSSILALHSKVFADMVEVSTSPQNCQTTIEGCPVVELHDSPEDVHWLLQVIYFSGILPVQKLRKRTFEKLEPIFLLADKYEMTGLTERILPMLERDWPSTLAAWDTNEAEITNYQVTAERRIYDQQEDPQRVDAVFPEPCRAIALARRCGIDSVLPSAFYHLSRIDASYRPEDDDDSDEVWEFLIKGGRTADPSCLTMQDWNSLYFGTGAIRRWCKDLRWELQPVFHSGRSINQHKTESPEYKKCSKALSDTLAAFDEQLFEPRRQGWGLDPLAVMGEFVQQDRSETKLCYSCSERLKSKLYAKRAEFWHELPGFFLLKDWTNPDAYYNDDE